MPRARSVLAVGLLYSFVDGAAKLLEDPDAAAAVPFCPLLGFAAT